MNLSSALLVVSLSLSSVCLQAAPQSQNLRPREVKQMMREAKTSVEFLRLADYCDGKAADSRRKAQAEQSTLDQLHGLRFHTKIYPIQVDTAQNRLRADLKDAKDYSQRAGEFREKAKGLQPLVPAAQAVTKAAN